LTEQLRKSICIGIPCYSTLPSFQTLEDYMRLSFALGRRYPEYDFFLAVRGKKEQFRARNSIVEEALRAGCDYLFFLDDDQIIDIDNSMLPSSRYLFLKRLIQHMDNDPAMGICGALYYQRDATDCWPVVMQVNRGGHGYSFLTHPEITGGLQRVAVTGGGAMLIRASVFDKIEHPWFRPELDFGTDIQICQKVQEAGFTVWCDTSVEIGHTRAEREVVCYKTIRELKVHQPEKSNQAKFENNALCTECKGECCKSMPGACLPDQFTAQTLAYALTSGNYCLDWLNSETMQEPDGTEEGNRAYFVRPSVKGRTGIFDSSKRGECVFLTEAGCLLSFKDRPAGCRYLEPKQNRMCVSGGVDVKIAAVAWLQHRDMIDEALNMVAHNVAA